MNIEHQQRSNSQGREITTSERITYSFALLRLHIKRTFSNSNFRPLLEDIERYNSVYLSITGRNLNTAEVVEIGYGQRPYRYIILKSLGFNVCGIDLDQPLLRPTPPRILKLIKNNGPVRALKSTVRAVVFDGVEYWKLRKILKSAFDVEMTLGEESLLIGDASGNEIWHRIGDNVSFIYSEDVFEHIPGEMLGDVVKNMFIHMEDDGLAIISPMIYTGICGGHEPEWYSESVMNTAHKRGPAWGHLTGETKPADTFLNKWTRQQYRDLFSKYFEILEEEVAAPELGRQLLTAERREALKGFSEDELFSNKVRFVLRKKTGALTSGGGL